MSPIKLMLAFLLMMGLLYVRVSVWLLRGSFSSPSSNNGNHNGNGNDRSPNELQQRRAKESAAAAATPPKQSNNNNNNNNIRHEYSDWRRYAVELAGKPPEEIVQILTTDDPFGVRTFEKRLLETESKQARFLTLEELQGLFPCPGSTDSSGTSGERITLPDQRNADKARAFRNGTEPYFLFFQHLRKAGGTNFCALAKDNMKKKELPKYFCSTYLVV